MKQIWFSILLALSLAEDVRSESYVLNIVTGLNPIAYQLEHGGNTLNEIMPDVPDGCSLSKWVVDKFVIVAIRDEGVWSPGDVTLVPGEGAILESPINFVLTVEGSRRVPVLPLPQIAQGGRFLVSRQIPEPGTFEDIVGAHPCPFISVYRFNVVTGQPISYVYDEEAGGWSPSVPQVGVGEPVLIDFGNGCTPIPVDPSLALICPPDKTVSCGTEWTFDSPVATNACAGSEVVLTVSATETNGACLKRITRTWTAADGCGHQAICSQTVTVQDTTPPELVCPSDKTVECGTPWSFDTPVALDLCSGNEVTLTVLSTITNGTCPMRITRTWEASDACTNRAICSQTVEVSDTTAPLLTGCANISVLAELGRNGAIVTFTPAATDVCAGAIPVICTPASGSLFPEGTNTVEAVATDSCGNRSTCEFQVIVRARKGNLLVEDTPYNYFGAPDLGREPDPNMAGQGMWLSRAIWVHENYSQPAGTFESHENPRYGQTNAVWVRVQNIGDGLVPDAVVEVYAANASLGLGWARDWTLLGTASLPDIAPGSDYLARVAWLPAGTGHYCLVARIVSSSDPMTTTETGNITANVRANNNLAWRNVNVANLLVTPGTSSEVRFKPVGKGKLIRAAQEPGGDTRQRVSISCKTEAVFHQGKGEVTLNLGTWFKRWQDAGGRGKNVEVVGENAIRFTDSAGRLDDIPMDDDEEAIVNLVVLAPEPLDVDGTEHLCHIELVEEVDGEAVGGVNYGVKTRARHTDTDHDGIPDVDDPDDDGDGVPDMEDPDPLGEPECPPAAVTIRRVDGKVVLSWSGLSYRLETTTELDHGWHPIPHVNSPYVLAPDQEQSFFRLRCH